MMYPLTNYHIPITYSCWNIGLHHKLSWKKLSPTKEKNTEKFEFFFSKSYLGYKFLTVLNIVSKFQEDWIRFEKVIAVYKTLTFGLTKMWTTPTTESMVAMSCIRDIRRRRDKNRFDVIIETSLSVFKTSIFSVVWRTYVMPGEWKMQ